MTMQLVIIESPYAGKVRRNTEYARRAMLDFLNKGEAPIASHLLYTQILDDTIREERQLGIEAGLSWGKQAAKTVVYMDYGISGGMKFGIAAAQENKRPIEYRVIGKNSYGHYFRKLLAAFFF